jgi:hypothetical protein
MEVKKIKEWDNELPTLIMHGINDSCDALFIKETKLLIEATAALSNKMVYVDCISEGNS